MAEVEANNLNRTARTDYDQANRSCQTELRDNATGEALYKTRLKYDKYNNLVQFAEKAGSESHTSDYSYDRDNRVTEIAYDGTTHKVGYTYDALGRVSSRVAECGTDTGKLTSVYTYVDGGYGTNSTTPLVKKIDQAGIPFEYAYDTRGNIISEKRGTLTTTYVYDALGQLIRVNDPHENATWVYEYDRGGNITSKVKYAYTTGTVGTAIETIPYTYGDTNWKDKLTSYNGQTITYDAIGNPLNDGIWTYEWQAGRQLKRMSAEGTVVSFKYDHNGLRTQKIVEQDWYPVTTNYTLHGKLLTHMAVDYTDWDEIPHQDKLHFFYDAQGRPVNVEFNGEMYTYLHNLQGDIVAIVDSAGSVVVEYKYDAWGKPLNTTGMLADTLGKRNPFRYRGYVYDEETGLYYLRSRYYRPECGRFVNADEVNSIFIVYRVDNCFAYCNCCPTMYIDEDGLVGKIFELGNGWFFRIDPPSAGDGVQRHIHVWKEGGPKYSQNADGSPHDGLGGTPPKWVRKKLEEMRKWTWRDKKTTDNPFPSSTPTPSPSPAPRPMPAPAPAPLPVPTQSTQKQQYPNLTPSVNWGAAVVGIVVGVVWLGAKILSAPYTGGLSLALP